MSRLFACCMISLVLLLGAIPLAAQDMSKVGCLSVQGGDSLWRISARVQQDPTLWERIYERNPFLQKNGRRFVNPANRWTYVLIRPGEQLCGLDELGIVPKLADTKDLTAMGFAPPKPEKVFVRLPSPWEYFWFWMTPLLIAMALLVLYAFFSRDPTRVGAGRVREEGIHTPTAAAEHFRQQLAQEFGAPAAFAQILSMVRGRAYGWARISDCVGTFFRRLLRGEPTWEVRARFRDGRQVIRYSLMACANDVRAGGGMMPGFGFLFVVEENVTDSIRPAVPPQPAPTPASTPQTAPAPAPLQETVDPLPASGSVTIHVPGDQDEEIQLREPDGEGFELVRLTNIDAANFTFRRGHNERGASVLVFRFRRGRGVKGASAPLNVPRAPAGSDADEGD